MIDTFLINIFNMHGANNMHEKSKYLVLVILALAQP